MNPFIVSTLSLLVSSASLAGGEGGLVAHGVKEEQHTNCVTPAQRAEAQRQIEEFHANNELPASFKSRGAPAPLFEFFPMGGNLYNDLYHNNYVDLDPTSGILDRECTDHTYNGHRGHDVDLTTFAEQEMGVPIYAVLDGVCVARDDGHFDMNTVWAGQPANFVVLEHPGGLRTLYWHMKNGSVLPQLGQMVNKGEQIGLTASSGVSTGPHLHFEVQQNFSAFEPSVGTCQSGDSYWSEPFEIRRDTYVRDFGFKAGNIFSFYNGPPEAFPRDKQLTFNDSTVSYWLQGHNLPQNSTYQMRFYRPDGSLEFNSGTRSLGFTSSGSFRWYWAGWFWTIPAMRAIEGEWRVEIDLNGETAVVAPITVSEALIPGFNRAPAQAVASFDPPTPTADDVIFARLGGDLVHDDPEYDLVSYEYTWIVNGQLVRTFTGAGRADAIPAALTAPGDSVVCLITPNDGTINGPVTVLQTTVLDSCAGDCDGSGVINFADLVAMLGQFGGASPACDADGSGSINFGDVVTALGLFGPCTS